MQSAHRTGYVYSVFFVMLLIPALALAGSPRNSSNRVVRFTAPADCDTPNGTTKQQVAFFLRNPKPGFDPVQSEVWRLRNEQGCTVQQDIVESFEKVLKIAQEEKVDYLDLAIYALGNKDKKPNVSDNHKETKTAQNSTDAGKREVLQQRFSGKREENGWMQMQSEPQKSPQKSMNVSETAKQCDALAAHPLDPNRRTAGVSWENLKANQAIDICTRALREAPEDPVLIFQLGRGLDKAGKPQEALQYYKSAAQKQYAMAFCNIGLSYLDDGSNLSQEQAAFPWYRKGAELGAPECQLTLGRFYRIGFNMGILGLMTKDYKKAQYWFEQALKNGHPDAKEELQKLAAQPMTDAFNFFGAFQGGGSQKSEEERAREQQKEALCRYGKLPGC